MKKLFKLFEESITTRIDSYAYGVVSVVAGTRFIIGSRHQAVIDSISNFLFSRTSDALFPSWEVSLNVVPPSVIDISNLQLTGDVQVEVKPGFSYRTSFLNNGAIYRSARGFDDAPHLIFVNDNHVSILAHVLNETTLRLPLRMVREVALRQAENHGGIFTHGACVRLGEKGILILGNSGHGKTTTLTGLLAEHDSMFVANDRGVCVLGNKEIQFFTWPTAVRVGYATVNATPKLHSSTSHLRRRENNPVRDLAASNEVAVLSRWGSKKKFEFTPAEFCDALGRPGAMMSTIDLVLLPRLSLGSGAPKLREAPHVDAIAESTTTPIDAEWGRGWLGVRAISDADLLNAKVRLLHALSELPCIAVEGDPNTSPGMFPQLVEKLRAALT